MQIDVLKNSLWTTVIKEIRKNNYDVTLANIFTRNAPKFVYSARMMTITWKLHEHFFYSIVMFNYDYMFPVAFFQMHEIAKVHTSLIAFLHDSPFMHLILIIEGTIILYEQHD